MIRNRSYHAHARRAGLLSCGQILEELVERAADRRQRFYRPGHRPKPGAVAKQSLQLELFADQTDSGHEKFMPGINGSVPRDAERPLFDLLPEAYEGL